MSYRIENKMPQFRTSAFIVLNDALREGARDVLILAKTKAPYDKGGLRSDTEINSDRPLFQRISFWKEYARFQELGGDTTRRVKRYTTPGTGKAFLKTAGDTVATRMNLLFKKHGGRARP